MNFLPADVHGAGLVRRRPGDRRVRVPPGGAGARRHGVHQLPAQEAVGGRALQGPGAGPEDGERPGRGSHTGAAGVARPIWSDDHDYILTEIIICAPVLILPTVAAL